MVLSQSRGHSLGESQRVRTIKRVRMGEKECERE